MSTRKEAIQEAKVHIVRSSNPGYAEAISAALSAVLAL